MTALRKNLCKNNQPQKNDFVVRAADWSLSFLFQYKLNTAVCQAHDAKYPDATEHSAVKSGYFAAASVQPVRIHYLKLTEHLAPVPKRHRPFFGYLRCCQIQCLKQCCIARKYASLLVQTAIAAVKAFNGIGGVSVTRSSCSNAAFSDGA